MNSFVYTTAIKKIRKMKARKKIIPGGTAAGKTYGIIPILIDKATKNELTEISVVSESIPHLRKGAIRDFLKIMKQTGRYLDERWNRTSLTYYFANGSFIEFFSVDDESKIRGPRRNILYINEANNIKFEAYHQLAVRTSHDIYIDYNPTKQFWVDTELLNSDDVEVLTLTYKDNEANPENVIQEIERAKEKAFYDSERGFEETNIKSDYWANWWKVYGLGQVGAVEGIIFKNWEIIKDVPEDARCFGFGLDFGFTNHPTACVTGWYIDGKRIYNEEFYKTGLTNRDIANEIVNRELYSGYADSAEPKSIYELQSYGIDIVAAAKGPDSIKYGIDLLNTDKFYITENSLNLIHELRNYMFEKERNGTGFYNRPATGQKDHLIDAMRYLATATIKNNNYPTVF